MSEELKRCPFCGGEVDFWTRTEAEDYQVLIIDCKDCPANMEEWVYKYDKNFAENFEKKKVEMFEAWNRRIERTAKVKLQDICWEDIRRYKEGMCASCGRSVYDHAKYCDECGCRLEWDE